MVIYKVCERDPPNFCLVMFLLFIGFLYRQQTKSLCSLIVNLLSISINNKFLSDCHVSDLI